MFEFDLKLYCVVISVVVLMVCTSVKARTCINTARVDGHYDNRDAFLVELPLKLIGEENIAELAQSCTAYG